MLEKIQHWTKQYHQNTNMYHRKYQYQYIFLYIGIGIIKCILNID
jgi:hypothetical protein